MNRNQSSYRYYIFTVMLLYTLAYSFLILGHADADIQIHLARTATETSNFGWGYEQVLQNLLFREGPFYKLYVIFTSFLISVLGTYVITEIVGRFVWGDNYVKNQQGPESQ